MSIAKISVAIVGGGISGATLANLLLLKHSEKLDVTIYESARKFGEIGAGIGIWGRVMEIFKDIDLYDACDKVAVKPHPNDPDFAFNLRISDQQPEGIAVGPWSYEGGSRFFSRSKLLDVLVANIPEDRVQFGKKLISYQHKYGSTGKITLHFSDGTSARCDVLIAADGIHSAVRKQMYNDAAAAKDPALGSDFDVEKFIEPAWTGTTAYRSLIPTEELRKVCPNHSILKEPQMYLGKDKHLVVYPANPTQINMVAFVTEFSKEGTQYPEAKWVKEVTQEELFKTYDDFEEEAQWLFKLMPKPSLWAVHTLQETLPFFARGNAVLVGDAAHAMTPHLGIGAGMGIEDAWVLATFLGSPSIRTNSDIPLALQAFDIARVTKTHEILHRARNQGMTYELRTEGVGRDPKLLMECIQGNGREIGEWKVADDVKRGLAWIQKEEARKAMDRASISMLDPLNYWNRNY